MTEQEWLSSEDPAAMLEAVQSIKGVPFGFKGSERRLRLWVEACRSMLPPAKWQDLVTSAITLDACLSVWADGLDHSAITLTVRAALLRDIIGNPYRPITLDPAWLTPTVISLAQATYDERDRKCLACNRWTDCEACHNTRRQPIADGTLDPDRLAVLSDALEEAGCDDDECPECRGKKERHWPCAQHRSGHLLECRKCNGTGRVLHPILAHLRSPGPHVRGCWAVDLLLGKE